MPAILVLLSILLVFPIIAVLGFYWWADEYSNGGVLGAFMGIGGVIACIILLATMIAGCYNLEIESINLYPIQEIVAEDGTVQVALVEGELVNITKITNVVLGDTSNHMLEVITYNPCRYWICYDGTAMMDQPTYKVVRAEL